MDCLCVGMYRACSTWQYEVIAHLLERHRDGQRLGYVSGEQYGELARRGRSRPGWRVLKSHEGHRGFAKALAEGRALAIYGYRDIRDVVFSLMHKRGATFEQLLGQGMIHQILVNDRYWSKRPCVLTQRYEAMITDPVAGVMELASALDLAISGDEAAEVAAEYSFQTNRRRTLELVNRLRTEGIDLDDRSNLQYYDPRTLLHWNHLREGRPGKWRTHATPEQRAVLARLCDAWLIAHDYEADTLEGVEVPGRLRDSLRREVELARAWSSCALRCASLRFPETARMVKPLLGIELDEVGAVPVRPQAHVRVDRGQHAALPQPAREHHSGHRVRDEHAGRSRAGDPVGDR
jgi:Sulfotransferase domain